MKPFSQTALSLIELLVALAVLAVVAGIITPRFLDVQKQAKDTVAEQIASELNHTYASWADSGGIIGMGTTTGDILAVLTSKSGTLNNWTNATDPTRFVRETPLAATQRISGTSTLSGEVGWYQNGKFVSDSTTARAQSDYLVSFNHYDKTFTVANKANNVDCIGYFNLIVGDVYTKPGTSYQYYIGTQDWAPVQLDPKDTSDMDFLISYTKMGWLSVGTGTHPDRYLTPPGIYVLSRHGTGLYDYVKMGDYTSLAAAQQALAAEVAKW